MPELPEKAKIGAVTFIQRFGSSLNLHCHYHTCVIDGLFYTDAAGEVCFTPAENLGVEDSSAIEDRVRTRVLRLFKRRDILAEDLAISMRSWRGGGGFSVNSDVRIDAEDRRGLGRLLRYCARPAFANDQLTIKPDGRIQFSLPKKSIKGETELILTPYDFLDKVAQLISRPRKHRHRYHGVLAPSSPMRRLVVSYANKPLPPTLGKLDGKLAKEKKLEESGDGEAVSSRVGKKINSLWAILIAQVYELMPLLCPECGGEMRVIALIKEQIVIDRILNHIGEPSEAPALSQARGPPVEEEFGQMDLFEDEVELVPDFEMDQTVAW